MQSRLMLKRLCTYAVYIDPFRCIIYILNRICPFVNELPLARRELHLAASELPLSRSELHLAASELPLSRSELRLAASELPLRGMNWLRRKIRFARLSFEILYLFTYFFYFVL